MSNAEKAVEEEIKQFGEGRTVATVLSAKTCIFKCHRPNRCSLPCVSIGGYVVSNPNIVVKALDLNSLDSVRAFAEDILATEDRIDYLICNAGERERHIVVVV